MCLLVFAWKTDARVPLIFAGNRDERHARASRAAGFWEDAPQILAGRDLEAGGTWLGITTGGRFAVVTNYRSGPNPHSGPRSRGELTTNFLRSQSAPPDYLESVAVHAGQYAPFSLLVGDTEALWYFSNRSGHPPQPVPSGIHGLSNHLLDTPWPKVTLSKSRLSRLLKHRTTTPDRLLELLADRRPAPLENLPDTGIGPERERLISPVFVVNPEYGTRCSSVIVMDRNEARFSERRFDSAGNALETRSFRITEAA